VRRDGRRETGGARREDDLLTTTGSFRHKDLRDTAAIWMRKTRWSGSVEVRLNYIKLDGNVAAWSTVRAWRMATNGHY